MEKKMKKGKIHEGICSLNLKYETAKTIFVTISFRFSEISYYPFCFLYPTIIYCLSFFIICVSCYRHDQLFFLFCLSFVYHVTSMTSMTNIISFGKQT